MSWIKSIPADAAAPELKKLYDRVSGPDGKVDNILQVHSLRPHSLEGHLRLYKNVLHHRDNTIPKWFLETLGVYVSHLNECEYCVAHHSAGLERLLNDPEKFARIRKALLFDGPETYFNVKESSAIYYARKLTRRPGNMVSADVESLRNAGWKDGEILEINQVVAYFAYANRTVLGLGVTTDGDVLGLSPGDNNDPENWGHR